MKEEGDHQPEQGDHHHQLEQSVAIPPGQHDGLTITRVSPVSQQPHDHLASDYSRLLKIERELTFDTCSLVY